MLTGAGNGLGRRHARFLAVRGAKVVVNDLGGTVAGTGSSRAVAEAVVEEIRAAGGPALTNSDSVATEEGGRNRIKTALDAGCVSPPGCGSQRRRWQRWCLAGSAA